ncbi:hypothetical protein EYR36_010568 [Pleurotus pulmonarius]|nr:hypothetical protein EYR36_010568 [Pleurotus pulmonarius]
MGAQTWKSSPRCSNVPNSHRFHDVEKRPPVYAPSRFHCPSIIDRNELKKEDMGHIREGKSAYNFEQWIHELGGTPTEGADARKEAAEEQLEVRSGSDSLRTWAANIVLTADALCFLR